MSSQNTNGSAQRKPLVTTFFCHALHANGAAKYGIDLANAYMRQVVTPAEIVSPQGGQMEVLAHCTVQIVPFKDYDYNNCCFGIVNSLMSLEAAVQLKKRHIPYVVIQHEFWDLDMAVANCAKRCSEALDRDMMRDLLLGAQKVVFVAQAQARLMPFVTTYDVVFPGVEIPDTLPHTTHTHTGGRDVGGESGGVASGQTTARTTTGDEITLSLCPPSTTTSNTPLRFCCVGSVYERKNQKQLIECFLQLAETYPEFEFSLDIVGLRYLNQKDIDYGNECIKLAQRDRGGRIRLHDPTLDVDAFYRRSDIFILLSHEEVSPVTILEAAARGLPTVAKRVGGIPELVSDRQTGVLVGESAGDEEVVECLKGLFNDREWVRRMGQAARRRAQKVFADRHMCERFIGVMGDVRKKIFLIDMDNCVVNWDAEFENRWTKRGFCLSEIDRKKSFEIEECVSLERRETVFEIISEPGFYEALRPFENAIESILELQKLPHIEVFLCTAPHVRSKTCLEEKARWVNKNLPPEFQRRVIFTHDKTIVQGDFLLDDNPNITGASRPVWRQILYRQPYNTGVFRWSDGLQDLLDLAVGLRSIEEIEETQRWDRFRREIHKLPDLSDRLHGTEYWREGYQKWRTGKAQGAKGETLTAAEKALNKLATDIMNMSGAPPVGDNVEEFRNGYQAWRKGLPQGAQKGVIQKY